MSQTVSAASVVNARGMAGIAMSILRGAAQVDFMPSALCGACHRVVFSTDQPHIIVVAPDYNGANGLNAGQARELAAALTAAADELDGWMGTRPGESTSE